LNRSSLVQLLIGVVIAVTSANIGWCAQNSDPAPELKTAKSVEVQYYLSLPKGWTAEKNWPILVTIDGAGHNFLGNCQSFIRVRGERPFIIVTPCVSSNGKDPADLKAVIAIVKEVQQEFKGEPKFFITGFSAGGHVTWQLVFNHPELLAGAAPAAANFRFRGIDVVSKAEERVKLPIHGFNGEKDSAVINEQWDDAEKHAREHGYENLSHTLVAGAGHTSFPSQVVNYFATLIQK
jgi:poly(3-hydroxybutyrate) depolymerase